MEQVKSSLQEAEIPTIAEYLATKWYWPNLDGKLDQEIQGMKNQIEVHLRQYIGAQE